MNIYFKIEIRLEDLSHFIHNVPNDVIMFIKIERDSDTYFGIVREDYYSEILKHVPRQSIESIEIVSRAEIGDFYREADKEPYERFFGNRALI
jgi:hypothetical protein